ETGSNPGVFTISRNGGTVGSLTVNYSLGGSAANGSDYAALSGSVIIPNGAASATVTISPVDDSLVEATETVTLTLSSTATYLVNSSSNTATVSILDNDVPALSINDVVITEGNSGSANAVFVVSLSTSFP